MMQSGCLFYALSDPFRVPPQTHLFHASSKDLLIIICPQEK